MILFHFQTTGFKTACSREMDKLLSPAFANWTPVMLIRCFLLELQSNKLLPGLCFCLSSSNNFKQAAAYPDNCERTASISRPLTTLSPPKLVMTSQTSGGGAGFNFLLEKQPLIMDTAHLGQADACVPEAFCEGEAFGRRVVVESLRARILFSD